MDGKKVNNNGYDYVDLGLPSGLLWATKNIGADTETDTGLYFQWGDTVGYTASQVGNGAGLKFFTKNDYKYYNNTSKVYTKYTALATHETLEDDDDAAIVNMGGDWRMPTKYDFEELVTLCTWNWTDLNGINGYKVEKIDDSSKYIFFPACGYAGNGRISSLSYGYYWSSIRNANDVSNACMLFFRSDYKSYDGPYTRESGFNIRGVISVAS